MIYKLNFVYFKKKTTFFTLILKSSGWHLKPLTSCCWVASHHDRQRLVYCTLSPIWARSASFPGTNTAPHTLCPGLIQPCHKPNPNRAHHGLADGISSALRKTLWVRAGPRCVQASSLAGALQGSAVARDNHISLEMPKGSTAVLEKCSFFVPLHPDALHPSCPTRRKVALLSLSSWLH